MITHYRRSLADALVPPVPLSADDVARIRGWASFLAAIALLYRSLPLAFWLLLSAVVLDSVDGVVARRQGLHCPQTDRAMDIFTEFVLCAAFLASHPGLVSTALMVLWVVPKTWWVGRYIKRRLAPDSVSPGIRVWQYASLVLAPLQSFPFSHALLVLVLLHWIFHCGLP